MEGKMHKLIEKFENDFDKIASLDGWTKEQIEMMKDLEKLMYYIEARCAMKEGKYEYEDDYSGARGGRRRDSMGRYSSDYDYGYDNRIPRYMYDDMSMRSGGMSGRRYSRNSHNESMADELEKALMETKNERSREAIEYAMRVLRSE